MASGAQPMRAMGLGIGLQFKGTYCRTAGDGSIVRGVGTELNKHVLSEGEGEEMRNLSPVLFSGREAAP